MFGFGKKKHQRWNNSYENFAPVPLPLIDMILGGVVAGGTFIGIMIGAKFLVEYFKLM